MDRDVFSILTFLVPRSTSTFQNNFTMSMALASFIDCRLNELNWTNCDTVTDFITVNILISDYSEVHSKKRGIHSCVRHITMDVLLKLEMTLKFTIVLPFLIYSTAVFITVLSCYEIQCNNLILDGVMREDSFFISLIKITTDQLLRCMYPLTGIFTSTLTK